MFELLHCFLTGNSLSLLISLSLSLCVSSLSISLSLSLSRSPLCPLRLLLHVGCTTEHTG
eukprot:COSAG05_NODE_2024_length_3677_cov_2.848239_1_plen_59_part_10